MTTDQLSTEIRPANRLLTAAEYHRLSDVPPEVEWFANLTNAHTRRAYENAVKDFMRFTGIESVIKNRTAAVSPWETGGGTLLVDKIIPILSLVVAALAVFVGPVISWRVAKRQIALSLAVSNKQIVAPMRQAWINNLRDVLSELTSTALHYFVTGYEERTDTEYQRITLLNYKVKLMLNPFEEDHQALEKLIDEMIAALSRGQEGDADFTTSHVAIVKLSREVFKREWNRVKDPIALP